MSKSELEIFLGENHVLGEQFISVSPEVKVWFPVPEPGEVNFEARLRLEDISLPRELIPALHNYLLVSMEQQPGYRKPKPDGVIIGLSGGIDSSVNALLARDAFAGSRFKLETVILGRASTLGERGDMNDKEYEDVLVAAQFAQDLGLQPTYIDIGPAVTAIQEALPAGSDWSNSGILPRIRSLFLFNIGDANNLVLVDTCNATEWHLTAFTSGALSGPVLPTTDLFKSEVIRLGQMIGVPSYIIERKAAVSELNLNEEQLYGGDCFIIDPIVYRLVHQGKKPDEVARELGHSQNWVRRIKNLRIEGERYRKIPSPFLVNERTVLAYDYFFNIDRGYFDHVGR